MSYATYSWAVQTTPSATGCSRYLSTNTTRFFRECSKSFESTGQALRIIHLQRTNERPNERIHPQPHRLPATGARPRSRCRSWAIIWNYGVATSQMLQQISTRRDIHVPDTIPSSLEHHLSQNQLSRIFPLDFYGDNMFLTITSDGLQLISSHTWQESSEVGGGAGHRG